MIIKGYLNGVSQDLNLSVTSDKDLYTAELVIPSKIMPIRGSGANHFEALLQIRNQIESEGWLLGVNASRVDASAPDYSKDFNDDQVIILTSKGDKHSINATQPASIETLSSIRGQRERYNQVRELIAENQKVQSKEDKKSQVVETRVNMPRATWGIAYAFASYFFISVLIFLFIPVGDPYLIGIATVGNFIFWSFSIVKCITDIAYNLTNASQWGLLLLLIQPVIFGFLIVIMVSLSIYDSGLDIPSLLPTGIPTPSETPLPADVQVP
jgi:hypothetical protein